MSAQRGFFTPSPVGPLSRIHALRAIRTSCAAEGWGEGLSHHAKFAGFKRSTLSLTLPHDGGGNRNKSSNRS
jgi:hypothetical protein